MNAFLHGPTVTGSFQALGVGSGSPSLKMIVVFFFKEFYSDIIHIP